MLGCSPAVILLSLYIITVSSYYWKLPYDFSEERAVHDLILQFTPDSRHFDFIFPLFNAKHYTLTLVQGLGLDLFQFYMSEWECENEAVNYKK